MARNDALNGALPILVLKILDRRGPMHGYGITSHIESASDHLRVEEGSLYPALHRLEAAKLVRAKWAITENNRRARMSRSPPPGAGSSPPTRSGGRL